VFEGRVASIPAEPWVDVHVPGPRETSPAEGQVRAAVAAVESREAALLTALGSAPSPALVETLLAVEAPEASDAVLLEAVAAWERVAAWAASRQAVLVEELRVRRRAQRQEEFAGDEVAARLAVTRRAGEAKIADASCLARVPVVWDALDGGRIDPYKARVLCDELLALPPALRFDVAAEVVPLADTLTAPQLRARIRRRAIAADPAAAARAHERERARRFVAVEPLRDGMAWLRAFLPAPDAVAVHTTLTAIADAQGSDDPRPMDARRADALVDVVTRWLDAGTTPDGRPLPTKHRRRPHLQVAVAATTLAGADDAPAELAGYGPVTADVARDIAARAAWSAVTVDPRTGEIRAAGPSAGGGRRRAEPGYRPPQALVDDVVARDRTCTFPGCRVPAVRCDIDHAEPYDPSRPADDQTVRENLHALCRHHHRLKTHGGWAVERDDATGLTRWTAPTGHAYVRAPERAVEPPDAGGAEPGGTVGHGGPGADGRPPPG
jgi:hypothetical protein